VVDTLDFDGQKVKITASNPTERRLAQYMLTEKEFVLWMTEVVKDKVFWDIGAAEGVYSILAAKNGAREVIAFEPDGPNRKSLEENIRLNEVGNMNIIVDGTAVWSENGTLKIETSGTQGDAPQPIDDITKHRANRREIVEVPAERMDQLAKKYGDPDIIKLDVEGGEYHVLEGLGDLRPEYVFLELHIRSSNVNPHDVGSILGRAGYEIEKGFVRGQEAMIMLKRKSTLEAE
jgi:FkbM family methyltransferase